MAIFVALFFQVIFVFFAMAINIGLVVHDKINLQNSVDLAAYYGAMKQAEVLNQIAHINYQMRQNYKLFVWRYRVLGTLGNKNHPLMWLNAGNQNLWPDNPSWRRTSTVSANEILPTVCVAHAFWQEAKDLDSAAATICQENGQGIPAIPRVAGGANFVPGASTIQPTFQRIANQIAQYCREAGLMNWMYASRILTHFRTDGYARKAMIGTLAANLTRPDPKDLRNEDIKAGVEKTFQRNLTDTNRGGVQNFQYFNSLGQGGCSQVKDWLVDIKINPTIFFSDWKSDLSSGQCEPAKAVPNRQGSPTPNPPYNGMDNLPDAFQYGDYAGVAGSTGYLQSHWAGEPNDEWHSSIGFEKNPWCMVYTGVKATTTIRKPFDPTGGGIILEARGFAKPFGGRIGPWYGKTWPQGSPNSVANTRTQMVDPLLPSRDVAGGGGAAQPLGDVADYSRFPGDVNGMTSFEALSSMSQNFYSVMGKTSRSAPPAIALANYAELNGLSLLLSSGDSLARTGTTPKGVRKEGKSRIFEIAAVAPDIFDAFYYSIEPRYYNNYFSQQTTKMGAQIPQGEQLYDFGSSKNNYSDPPLIANASPQFSVIDQIQTASGGNTYLPDYRHIIRKWENLLTSWHQKGVVNYDLDTQRFGQCIESVDKHNPNYPTPGNCIYGGRTGYSVKSVSRDYLLSSEHALGGGASGAAGAILNPPSF